MIDIDKLNKFVEKNIAEFHANRIKKIANMKFLDVFKRKNPYLYRVKNIESAAEIVEAVLEAYLSSQEETIFGAFLEKLAIYISKELFNGTKSSAKGIDLEFEREGKRYLVSIKSGPNWGNSSQIKKLKTDFISAKKTLRTSGSKIEVVSVNGCCYGRCASSDKGEYFKYCGQEFWSFISGNDEFYLTILNPLGYKAKEMDDEFKSEVKALNNLFTGLFIKNFCYENGHINWEKLTAFNSARESMRIK